MWTQSLLAGAGSDATQGQGAQERCASLGHRSAVFGVCAACMHAVQCPVREPGGPLRLPGHAAVPRGAGVPADDTDGCGRPQDGLEVCP